jgi:hypothetical protein
MTDKLNYSHGDQGDRPNDGTNFQDGDAANPETFDWLFTVVPSKIDSIIDTLTTIDSNGDGVVDEAEYANDADASTYKGNDIDPEGNGIVNRADSAATADVADDVNGVDVSNVVETSDLNPYATENYVDGVVRTNAEIQNAVDGANIDISGTADYATDADASTYKGNDIDPEGNGIVTQAADADAIDGWDKADIKSWVNNNADVPDADYADSAGDSDTVDGWDKGDIQNYADTAATSAFDPQQPQNVKSNRSVNSTYTSGNRPRMVYISFDTPGSNNYTVKFVVNGVTVVKHRPEAEFEANENAMSVIVPANTDYSVNRSGDSINLRSWTEQEL